MAEARRLRMVASAASMVSTWGTWNRRQTARTVPRR